MHYTPTEVALLLRVHVSTVREWIREDALRKVVNLGSSVRPDYRVPASSINAFLDVRRVFREEDLPEVGIRACSEGELRRKAG